MRNWIKTRFIKLITFIGLSSFQTKDGSSYRVTGYYYCYNFRGGNRKFVRCHKLFANMIGGYGVCGCYKPFHEVSSVRFSFRRWFFFKESINRFFAQRRRQIKRDKASFKFLRSIEKGLTEKEYEDVAWDMTWADFQKSFKKSS
jgi:hypothetical protein